MDEITPTAVPAIEPLPITERELIPARFRGLIAPAVFALLTFAMFADVLFTATRVVSHGSTDLALQFVPWREFGFTQLAQGNLPLWNPHVYGGAPYFAGFQAALIYPPNWLHLILPLGTAINWIIAIHVFLAGYFTYLWCRGRGVGIGGSILAGVMFMFGGPYFLHLYAGHLPHLAVMVWTPLMLLTIDKLAETGQWKWCIVGILATAMHILAGHPQYVYYTGMALSIYAALRLIGTKHHIPLIAGFAIMYFGAVLVTAAQLLPGIQATTEQVRSGGLPYDVASTFSMPPKNLITMLVPTFFRNVPSGDPQGAGPDYWGAGYLWEVSFFLSIAGLVMAAVGAVRGERRAVLLILAMIVITGIFALGRHTPLYWPMYKYLPAYGSFRGTVKFAYISTLFIALLAGVGFDGLLRNRRLSILFPILAGLVALVMVIYGALIWSSAGQGVDSEWARFLRRTVTAAAKANEYFFQAEISPAVIANAGRYAAKFTFLGAGVIALIGGLLWASRFNRWVPYLLVVTACVELFIFARATRATMDPAIAQHLPDMFKPWEQPLKSVPADQRVLITAPNIANLGMSLGYQNVNGYDPGVFKRYAELVTAMQGKDPSTASQYLLPPAYLIQDQRLIPGILNVSRMLRCAIIFDPARPPIQVPNPLPVALLVSDFVQIDQRNAILGYILSPAFNPANTVVLESAPEIKPQPVATPLGTVKVLSQTTDTVELQADVERAAILVVTNNYSTGWRVVPIESPQRNFSIMPANYTQLGLPLEAGRHHLVLEYSPLAFRLGRWVSAISLLGLAAGSILLMRRRV